MGMAAILAMLEGLVLGRRFKAGVATVVASPVSPKDVVVGEEDRKPLTMIDKSNPIPVPSVDTLTTCYHKNEWYGVGDVVTWDSQANGTWKNKKGKIVAVLKAYVHPRCFYGDKVGKNALARSTASVVVECQGKLYWPRMDAIEKVK